MMIRQEIRLWLIHGFYILFFLFLIHRLFFPSFGMAERCMSFILYPFFKIHLHMNQSVRQQSIEHKTIQSLKNELEVLYVQHDVLKGRLIQLQAQQRLIEQTKELVDFSVRYDTQNKYLAKILMCSCGPYEDIIFIDGGKNHNIVKDDIVVYQNALIGRVIQVFPWYSKVALISDKRCRIAAEVSHGVKGICCGQNNKVLSLDFVPHFKPVQVGDLVMSTGQGLMYPHGFALGIVLNVKTDLVAHDIQLQSVFDITSISYVYVLHKE